VAHFVEVGDEAQLDEVFHRSERQTELLYLNDPYCGLSDIARSELSDLDIELNVVNVHSQARLLQLIEERTGVRHESPQVLVLEGGLARWSASHRKVTAAALNAALTPPVGVTNAKPGSSGSLRSRPAGWLGRRRPAQR
jgi:bacillithiol system protein YtxJ